MTKPSFVYVTYIASTPEKVFAALTSAQATEKYWFGNALISDWKVGSPMTMTRKGVTAVKSTILENDPPRRLAYTFSSQHDGLDKEKPSRVVIDIEQQKDQVKLTVTHDDFEPGAETFKRIGQGWPLVLSSLKSFLETGTSRLTAPWYDAETAEAS
jgi:uncharacterized protein YndB with AHSA1/START domain